MTTREKAYYHRVHLERELQHVKKKRDDLTALIAYLRERLAGTR